MLTQKEKILEILVAIEEQDITDEHKLDVLLDQALNLIGTAMAPKQPTVIKTPDKPVTTHLTTRSGYHIYCDGSCAGNPGPGGWGTLVEINGEQREFSGSSPKTTNNIMEMTAALEGLKRIPEQVKVTVTTDSQYLIKGMTQWMKGWKKKGWKKADGKPVLNQELWTQLDRLAQTRSIQWKWVKGHAGHIENERCDQLAKAAIRH